MKIKLLRWYGRLGNNIIQLKNAICIGLYYNFEEISFPTREFFNKNVIDLTIYRDKADNPDNPDNPDNSIFTEAEYFTHAESNNFFNENRIKGVNKECFTKNIIITKEILRDLFVIKHTDYRSLTNNDLVIHIRSGDIFNETKVHESYVMPPLSYYKNIIENNKHVYKTIYLIAEDIKNPVILELCKLYPNMQFAIRSLKQDIELILRSRNIIASYGSFIPSLLLLTSYVQNVYIPSYALTCWPYIKEYLHESNVIFVDLNNYKKMMGKWCNTTEQRNMMITY